MGEVVMKVRRGESGRGWWVEEECGAERWEMGLLDGWQGMPAGRFIGSVAADLALRVETPQVSHARFATACCTEPAGS